MSTGHNRDLRSRRSSILYIVDAIMHTIVGFVELFLSLHLDDEVGDVVAGNTFLHDVGLL